MTTIYLDRDERYPVYSMSEKSWGLDAVKIEVPEEKVQEWLKAEAEFNRVQDEMAKYYGEGR